MSLNIDQLLKFAQGLDPQKTLEGLTYAQDFNESLGFGVPGKIDPSNFLVPTPWNPWPNPAPAPAPTTSSIEDAFISVIKDGICASPGGSNQDKKTCFIDITHLDGETGPFFTEPTSSGSSIGQELANAINSMDPSITPVVRFLAGCSGPGAPPTWADAKSTYENIFWPNGTPLVSHDKAEFYVGLYSPNAVFPNTTPSSNAVKMFNELKQQIKQKLDDYNAFPQVASLEKMLDNMKAETTIPKLQAFLTSSISWNHAKIVAVNGRSMMTGGVNYWRMYCRNSTEIVDLSMRVRGDAAVSAHAYADYLWKYLNTPHSRDKNSYSEYTKLNSSSAAWTSNKSSPLASFKKRLNGGLRTLTIAQAGDWIQGDFEYPLQTVNAMRDLLLNVMWVYINDQYTSLVPLLWPQVTTKLSDEALLPTFSQRGISPAAWASRATHIYAVANAQKSIHISTEMLVNFLQVTTGWTALVTKIMTELGLKDNAWNGYLWPFDLLQALAQALITFDKLPVPSDADADEGVIKLIITTSNAVSNPGWEDKTSVKQVKNYLAIMMKTIDPGLSDDAANGIIQKRFLVKRVLQNNTGTTEAYNHCKVTCVDASLLYIGSDNAYPTYNEEHGCWIEDKSHIKAWLDTFFFPEWRDSTPATD